MGFSRGGHNALYASLTRFQRMHLSTGAAAHAHGLLPRASLQDESPGQRDVLQSLMSAAPERIHYAQAPATVVQFSSTQVRQVAFEQLPRGAPDAPLRQNRRNGCARRPAPQPARESTWPSCESRRPRGRRRQWQSMPEKEGPFVAPGRGRRSCSILAARTYRRLSPIFIRIAATTRGL
jgi:hypothetical protein